MLLLANRWKFSMPRRPVGPALRHGRMVPCLALWTFFICLYSPVAAAVSTTSALLRAFLPPEKRRRLSQRATSRKRRPLLREPSAAGSSAGRARLEPSGHRPRGAEARN